MDRQALLDAARVVASLQDEETKLSLRHQEVKEALAQASATYAKIRNEQLLFPNCQTGDLLLVPGQLSGNTLMRLRTEAIRDYRPQVTSLWRDIALSTQLFWSTINLVVYPQTRWWGRELQTLETYLVRSGCHYLPRYLHACHGFGIFPLPHRCTRLSLASPLLHSDTEQHVTDVYRSFRLVEAPTSFNCTSTISSPTSPRLQF